MHQRLIKVYSLFIVALFVVMPFFSLSKTVHAQLGGGPADASAVAGGVSVALGCTGIVGKLKGKISNLSVGGSNGSSVPVNDSGVLSEEEQQNKKEECFDNLAWNLAKTGLARITNDIVNWINTGFDGEPTFVRDGRSYFKSVAKLEIDTFSNQLLNSDNPFKSIVVGTLNNSIINVSNYFDSAARFSLGEVTRNYGGASPQDFYNDFAQGEFQALLSMATHPGNNPFSLQFTASQEIGDRLRGTDVSFAQTLQSELLQGSGFLSIKECAEPSNYNRETWESMPTITDEQVAAKEAARCKRWETHTPGSFISNQINWSSTTGIRQNELADELNESLAAVFDALINQVVQKGLSKLSKSIGSSNALYASNSIYIDDPTLDNNWFDSFISEDVDLDVLLITGFAPRPERDNEDNIVLRSDGAGGTTMSIPFVDFYGGDLAATGYAFEIPALYDVTTGLWNPNTDVGTTVLTDGTSTQTVTNITLFDYLHIQEELLRELLILTQGEPPSSSSNRDPGLMERLRELDRQMPHPNFGWRERINEQLVAMIEAMNAKENNTGFWIAGKEFYYCCKGSAVTSAVLGGFSDPSGTFTGIFTPDDAETTKLNYDGDSTFSASEQAPLIRRGEQALREEVQKEIRRIEFDIINNNIPASFEGNEKIAKIPQYQDIMNTALESITLTIANTNRLNYIREELIKHDNGTPTNTTLESLERTFASIVADLPNEEIIFQLQAIIDEIKTERIEIDAIITRVEDQMADVIALGMFPNLIPNPYSVYYDENLPLPETDPANRNYDKIDPWSIGGTISSGISGISTSKLFEYVSPESGTNCRNGCDWDATGITTPFTQATYTGAIAEMPPQTYGYSMFIHNVGVVYINRFMHVYDEIGF